MNYFAYLRIFLRLGRRTQRVTKSLGIVARKLRLVTPDLGLTGCTQRACSAYFVMLSGYVLSTDLCYCSFKIVHCF